MKRVIVMILSLAVMLSGTAVFAADSILKNDGEKFVDIAYNGQVYVALAKSNQIFNGSTIEYAYPRLYYSTDGLTWAKHTLKQPDAYVNSVSANPQSQQQLVWWASKNKFVFHSVDSTYTSTDGMNWTKDPNIKWSGAAMTEVSGDYLILGANQKARAAGNALKDQTYSVTSNVNYFTRAVAAKPIADDGSIDVFMCGLKYAYDLKYTPATDTWTAVSNKSGGYIPTTPKDAMYSEKAGQYLIVDGEGGLIVAVSSTDIKKFTIKPNVNVTGVNASDKYIVVGMSDGTMYYTNNAPITSDTVWTEIKPFAGASAGTEPVKNFAFSSDSEFVALGTTQIYKGSIDGYCNVSEYNTLPQISTPDFSQEVISQNDGYHAKTASFEITQANDKIKGVKVTVNGESQTKSLANVDATMKFGIILISDNAEKLDNAQVSVQMLTE